VQLEHLTFIIYHLNTGSGVQSLVSNNSSSNCCPLRTVINSVPQIGQGTNSFSPTKSNSNFSLHPGQENVVDSLVISIVCSPETMLEFVTIKKCVYILY
jgi:hypothetical protein